MKFTTVSLLPVLAIAAACGGSGASDSLDSAQTKSAVPTVAIPSNAEILGRVFDNDRTVPDGFFVDELVATNTRSYTVHHVLDTSNSYELCSDDLVEAQAWEQADNDSRSVSGYYVSSYENERYFEFVRELSYDQDIGNINEPTSPGYARVFKCSHTNRDGVDRSLVNGFSGMLAANALDKTLLREFTEYLWQFRFFNVSRKVVLESYSVSDTRHTLLLAFLVNQGAQLCDRIDVIEWRFSAHPQTGSVSKEFETVRSFTVTLNNGSPQFCV